MADRYRIERELGAGGMATVYLAHDLRHDRDVAIKVLHPDLAAALGSDRFLSEIKTTAKLQHPHILPLLDSGESDGLLFYVMPYVRGDTLRDRLQRETQLPVTDALRIANEIADALDSAHAIGIVHRDIKPENILLQGEHALVADFGIALAVQHAGGARMTQTGLSLGTPQYMAPEQAMGDKLIDHRADIYALGAVTYEMLTGEPPHTGANAQAIVAKLLTEAVRPVRALRPAVSEHVDAALQVALQKLPADRFAAVKEFADALRGGANSRVTLATAPPAAPKRSTSWLPVAIGLNVLLIAGIAALMRHAPEAATSRQQVVLWHTSIPGALVPGATFIASQAAISPDGETIVFTDSTNGWMLMRKRRNAVAAEPIDGTQGGVSPCFSPDGKWIAFVTLDGRVKKVPTEGGSPITIAEDAASDYKAIAWLDDGSVAYVATKFEVTKVSASGGGTPRTLRMPKLVNGNVFGFGALPGSRGLLMTVCRGNCLFTTDVFLFDFAADSARILIPKAVGSWYSPTGHVLFTSRDGGLFAAGFDLKTMQLRSDPVPVIDGVAPGMFSTSAAGSIVYALDGGSTALAELMWVSRDGRTEPFDSTWKAHFEYPAISPDGNRIAISTKDRTTDLWIHRADGSRRKVIAPQNSAWRPAWFAGGRYFTFIGVGDDGTNANDVTVWRADADANGVAERIFRHRYPVYEAEVSPDTQWMVFRTDEPVGSANIYARHLHGDTTLVPIAAGPSNDIQIALSPDGKRIAFTSSEAGVQQVFVASFPDPKIRRLVSRGRGYEPRWSHSGKELFFESGGRLMSVAIGDGADITVSEPRPLFALSGYRRARNRAQYDIAPGDQKFLMIKDPPPPAVPPVVYAEHWLPELLAKVKK